MSYQSIREYLAAISDDYKKVRKAGKTKILSEACRITGLTRKHLVRTLLEPKEKLLKRKASGRPRRYGASLLLPHVGFLWNQMERISAGRMKAALPDWLPHYAHPDFTFEVRVLLLQMSGSTLERLLKSIRANTQIKKGLSATCPARFMKNRVPLNTHDAKIEKPGFFQADTVAHCGTTTAGSYLNSVTLTDIDSTWTENRAMHSKRGAEVRKVLFDIQVSLDFDVLAINTDSGSEFLNHPVLQFMQPDYGRKQIVFTRSRPYRKNDNCYVEQKNYTHVRELFGYERFEDPRLVPIMNDIYKTCWNPLQNFFLPTFKLKEKIRIGARIVKKFDRPQTPYDRLINSAHLTEEQKRKLRERKAELNPFHLKANLEAKLKIFFDELRKSKTREVA